LGPAPVGLDGKNLSKGSLLKAGDVGGGDDDDDGGGVA
jgi:hypothetical protein